MADKYQELVKLDLSRLKSLTNRHSNYEYELNNTYIILIIGRHENWSLKLFYSICFTYKKLALIVGSHFPKV